MPRGAARSVREGQVPLKRTLPSSRTIGRTSSPAGGQHGGHHRVGHELPGSDARLEQPNGVSTSRAVETAPTHWPQARTTPPRSSPHRVHARSAGETRAQLQGPQVYNYYPY